MSLKRFFGAPTVHTIVKDSELLATQVDDVKVVYALDGQIAWIVPAQGSTDAWDHHAEVYAVCEAAANMARAGRAQKMFHVDKQGSKYLTHMRSSNVFEWSEDLLEGSGGYVAMLDNVLRFCEPYRR
jgi:hypothetical protein